MDLDRLASMLTGLEGTLLRNEPMAKHTTFCAGGPADLLFLPASEEAAALSLRAAREEDIPCMVIGTGSNLVVPSAGIRGLVVAMADGFSHVERNGTVITAQAGAKLTRLARTAAEASLSGLEFASGIPGSAGGGTAMNAGAYDGQLSDV
ncbi:MAG: FAD-binding protein, partial [Clostridia bacterium]|nr:FAD-binding protein [Clostridia bacterium]